LVFRSDGGPTIAERFTAGSGGKLLFRPADNLKELRSGSPKKRRATAIRCTFGSEDIGDPMLAQHLDTLMIFRRLAIERARLESVFAHSRSGASAAGRHVATPVEDAPATPNDEAAN
jgi:hypothetical protein